MNSTELADAPLDSSEQDWPIDYEEVSELIQQSKIAEALHVLRSGIGYDTVEWHLLNALALYRQSGETLVSRSALAHALTGEAFVADVLINEDTSMFLPAIEPLGKDKYVAATRPAWKAEGALEWLRNTYDDPFSRLNRDDSSISERFGDKQRWKRWEDNFEKAERALADEDLRLGRKILRECLREADRIEYCFGPFYETMTILLDLADEGTEDAHDLRKRIEERVKRFDAKFDASDPMHAFEYHSLGMLFLQIEELESSLRQNQLAMDALEKLVVDGPPFVTLVELNEARSDVANCLSFLDRHAEALVVITRVLESQESYLGDKHIALSDSKEIALECVQAAGDQRAINSCG